MCRCEAGWSHTHVRWLKIRRDILDAEVPTEEQEVLTPHWALQARASVLGRGVQTTSACENHQGFSLGEMEDC